MKVKTATAPRLQRPPSLRDSWTRRRLEIIGLVLAAPLAVYLFCIAWTLRLDYYDSYDIFLNARCIATGFSRDWRAWRSLGMPLLLSPCFAIERFVGGGDFGFRASHLVAVGFWAALIVLCFAIFRIYLSRFASVVVALLLALNPLMVHYAPMAKEDIPATAFTVACFYCYLRASARNHRKGFVAAGIFAGLATVTRQNLLPLIMGALLIAEIIRGFHHRESLRYWMVQLVCLFLLPAAIFLFSSMLVYPPIGMSSAGGAPGLLLEDMRTHAEFIRGNWQDEGAAKNFRFVAEAMTYPVCFIAIIGMAVAWKRRVAGAAFNFVWFATFFGLQTLGAKHREARYLFAAFPPLYFFAGVTIESIRSFTARRSGRMRALVLPVMLITVMIAPLVESVRMCFNFLDPVYYDNFESRVSRFAADLAGTQPIAWLGPYYPLHPRQFIFDRGDESTSIYHFGVPVFEFYASQPAVDLHSTLHNTGDIDEVVLNFPEIAHDIPDGCIFIVSSESADYRTDTLPALLKPLTVRRLRNWDFGPLDATPRHPVSFPKQEATVAAQISGKDLTIKGSGFSCRKCAVILTFRNGSGRPTNRTVIATVAERRFQESMLATGGALPSDASILFFDTETPFKR